jgi:hypothetical protein
MLMKARFVAFEETEPLSMHFEIDQHLVPFRAYHLIRNRLADVLERRYSSRPNRQVRGSLGPFVCRLVQETRLVVCAHLPLFAFSMFPVIHGLA